MPSNPSYVLLSRWQLYTLLLNVDVGYVGQFKCHLFRLRAPNLSIADQSKHYRSATSLSGASRLRIVPLFNVSRSLVPGFVGVPYYVCTHKLQRIFFSQPGTYMLRANDLVQQRTCGEDRKFLCLVRKLLWNERANTSSSIGSFPPSNIRSRI
jgi:hypothetical protein